MLHYWRRKREVRVTKGRVVGKWSKRCGRVRERLKNGRKLHLRACSRPKHWPWHSSDLYITVLLSSHNIKFNNKQTRKTVQFKLISSCTFTVGITLYALPMVWMLLTRTLGPRAFLTVFFEKTNNVTKGPTAQKVENESRFLNE